VQNKDTNMGIEKELIE